MSKTRKTLVSHRSYEKRRHLEIKWKKTHDPVKRRIIGVFLVRGIFRDQYLARHDGMHFIYPLC